MKRLIGCLLAASVGLAHAAEDDFNSRCGSGLPKSLAPTADTGVVIVDAALRAYVPVEMPVPRGIVTLSGTGKGLGSRSSRYQCTEFMVLPELAPGRYRLSSLEGMVSSAILPQRFLYPMPGDGYQVVNPHDWREGPQRYRVQPRRAPELEVEVKAGEVTYFGRLEVVRNRGSAHAVMVKLEPDAAREKQARARLRQLAGLPPINEPPPESAPPQSPVEPGAPAAPDGNPAPPADAPPTAATPPATEPPAAAAP